MEIPEPSLLDRSFTDQFGNLIGYKICRFEFDEIELIGDLEMRSKEKTLLKLLPPVVISSGELILKFPENQRMVKTLVNQARVVSLVEKSGATELDLVAV